MFGSHAASAYIGIALYMVLPMVFFLGLALIPAGIFIWRKQKKEDPKTPGTFPELNWRNPELRKLVTFVGLATVANVAIGGVLTYRAVEHMESTQFCGTTCHTVMKPEYTAYQNSPHSRVGCVQCHIGEGASWFVKSKISGAWQVIAVATDIYPRPIPTPVKNLRPARETCEACHWPEKFGGNRLRIIPKYTEDGKAAQTVLMMHIGGGDYGPGGIHGVHLAKGTTIRYGHSDEGRQKIPWVEVIKNGKTEEYKGKEFKAMDGLTVRTMDCMDCHNRPSHTFQLPERALNLAMASGEVMTGVPGLQAAALAVMKADYKTEVEAAQKIPVAIVSFFKEKQPAIYAAKQALVEKTAQGVLAAFNRNVFPDMNVKWGNYPINIGHEDYPGCFRCHDAEHKSKTGEAITQDCSTCHEMLAMEEENPKILTDLGVKVASN